jgi:hypothetical protein
MFRSIGPAAVLALLTCATFSAPRPASGPPNPQPTEVKIISAPPAQPTEVKIISAPPATPAEVKIVSTPENPSEHALVTATWGLLIANMLLCVVTIGGSWKQGRDLRQRDRATMEREVNRAANKVMVTASRLGNIARQVPAARDLLNTLLDQGGMPQIEEENEERLQLRSRRLSEIEANALEIVSGNLPANTEKELTAHVRRLDSHEVQLDVMREAITEELSGYQAEILIIREQRATMRAAALNATMSIR